MAELLKSFTLLLVLLNPFLVVIYLVDVIQKIDSDRFRRVLAGAGLITCMVFSCFAILGDAVFSRLMQAEFASFQIFGGTVFLLIGLQFVFKGPDAIELLRGESPNLAGAIAMPVLIGPGTISASVLIGKRHHPLEAVGVIVVAIAACLVSIALLKSLHDYVKTRNEALIERYIEVAGRITALFVGTVAVDMIMQGIRAWLEKF